MTIVAILWQFVSRSDMTRDNMSQVLGAWGLRLGAWGFFIIPDPRSIANVGFTAVNLPHMTMDQGSVPVDPAFI